mmetsp:Transcript_6867/g.14713  ORF Transcript_6867/g.14713 Transcript_6867/m.14713 type:complete len:81 (-) Transcript_6867:221-463(-)
MTDLADGLEAMTQQAETSRASAFALDKLDTCWSKEKPAAEQYETYETNRAAKIVSDAQHCQTKGDATGATWQCSPRYWKA